MSDYIAIRPASYSGTLYLAGERIPEEAILSRRAKALITAGRIVEIKHEVVEPPFEGISIGEAETLMGILKSTVEVAIPLLDELSSDEAWDLLFEFETRKGILDAARVILGLPPAVTFEAVQTGGTSTTADSTGIAFTFDKDVVGLLADHITLTNGTGEAVKGELTGSAKSWMLGIVTSVEGDVTVKISGLEAYSFPEEATTVAIYKGAGGG